MKRKKSKFLMFPLRDLGGDSAAVSIAMLMLLYLSPRGSRKREVL